MKKLVLIILIIGVLSSCKNICKKHESNKMSYAFFVKSDTLDYDFGLIRTNREHIYHKFKFTNISHDTLYISTIPIACSCLSVKYSKRPIFPQENFYVNVTYKQQNKKGVFNRRITIIFNEGKYYSFVTIRGIVK